MSGGASRLCHLSVAIAQYATEIAKPDSQRLNGFTIHSSIIEARAASPAPAYPQLDEVLLPISRGGA
jgi:hypothetical protein